ncbi:hypothetical protein EC968_003711 [Mortierella alpina]|nr:hypothetical protein EC968_003711 [Mortierella alpina]
MKRAGQPPRSLPASTGRVSFECGNVDERRPVSKPSPASPVSISAAKTSQDNLLSSSAPSAYLTCYTPFSAFSDDDVAIVPKTMCYKNGHGKQASDGREKEPLYSQEHQQCGDRWASFRDNEDVIPDVAQEKVSEVSLSTTDQDARALLASRRAPPSSAPAASPAATAAAATAAAVTIAADGTASSNHLRAAPGIPTRAQSTKIKRSSEPGSGPPPSMREQRRHSSEDGLISTRILAMCLSRSHQEPPIDDDFAIPSKCRMVFHMRDEVSKVKGQTSAASGREEDKTGLKRNSRPQQQPRQQQRYNHDPMQQPMREFGLKKSASTKCAKTVSFKEPEPWKTCTTTTPQASTTAESTAATTTATTTAPLMGLLSQDEKRRTETEQPAVMLSEPISLCDSYAAAEQPSLATASGSHLSVESTAAGLTRPSSAPASYEKRGTASSSTSAPARTRQGHQRNLSESSLPSSSSSASLLNADSRGRTTSTTTTPPTSKSRFSRLWKSLAQRYTHHHQHQQQQQQHPHGVARLHVSDGPGGLIRRGSDLEPLVAMARD